MERKETAIKHCTLIKIAATDQAWGRRSGSYLLGVLKLPPETLIHSFGGFLRTTHHGLNIDLKATVQKLVYLPVIIVVIPDEHGRDTVSGNGGDSAERDGTHYKIKRSHHAIRQRFQRLT